MQNIRKRTAPRLRGARLSRSAVMAIPHPPPVFPQVKQSMRLRFSCTTAATNKQILFLNILDSVLFAATAVVGYDLFTAVRVKAVEVWALPSQGSAPTPVRVQFPALPDGGGLAGDGRVFSDTSMGIEPAHVIARPDPKSALGLWNDSNGTVAFLLTCPIGAVIDVLVDFRIDQNVTPSSTNALVAATVGNMYFRGLDGLAVAATTLPADAPLTR
jgi:hypothetical protein